MRKFGVFLLSVILFFALLVTAFSTSSNMAFTHPNKIKKWLNQSNLYGAFVENAIVQAQKTTGADGSGGVSLSDAAVKQRAQASFSSQALQKDVDTVIDSNYSWLEGKTNKPSFSVDLSNAKQSFADRVGQYVTTYLNGLPACTPAQQASFDSQTTDPLMMFCRPSDINPAQEGAQVTEQIANNGNFLSDPVVTADNINPDGTMYAAPYYQRLSSLPPAYQVGKKIPLAAAAAVVASTIGIFFLAARRRKGLKIIGVILAVDGLILIATRLVSDQAFNKLQRHVFNENTIGQLQKALTTFFNLAEQQLVKVDTWFGIGYLVLALIVLIVLRNTRKRELSPALSGNAPVAPKRPPAAPATKNMPRKTAPPRPATKKTKPTSYPKRPRLIQ